MFLYFSLTHSILCANFNSSLLIMQFSGCTREEEQQMVNPGLLQINYCMISVQIYILLFQLKVNISIFMLIKVKDCFQNRLNKGRLFQSSQLGFSDHVSKIAFILCFVEWKLSSIREALICSTSCPLYHDRSALRRTCQRLYCRNKQGI